MDPGHASLVWGRGAAPLAIPRRSTTPGDPLGSRRERVGRENGIVEDHRLGLTAEQAKFQLMPESAVSASGLMVSQPVEPLEGLIPMSQAVVSHRQERPVRGGARRTSQFDSLFQSAERSSNRPARYRAARGVQEAAPLASALTPRTVDSASRTGTSGSALPSGPSHRPTRLHWRIRVRRTAGAFEQNGV